MEISLEETEKVVGAYITEDGMMKTLTTIIPREEFFQWQMLGLTQMDLNFSFASIHAHILMESTLCLGKYVMELKSLTNSKQSVHQMELPNKKLSLQTAEKLKK